MHKESLYLIRHKASSRTATAFFLFFFFSSLYAAAPASIDFAYVGDTAHHAYTGVQQGLIEANLQGQFLGKKYTVTTYEVGQWERHDLSGSVGIFSVDKDTLLALSATYPKIPVFNLSVFDDALRQDCRYNLLHIIPSDSMLRDAVAQWKKKQPNAVVTAQAWHADFKKFAALDLNKRFLKNQKKKMDDYAWAGWAGIKVVSDTISRFGLMHSNEVLSFLRKELSFDGQKGASMDFRATGQLNQPVLLIERNKIVAEAPVRGVAASSALKDLGRLACKR